MLKIRETYRIDWLFQLSDNFYPSIYFDTRLSAKEKTQMIEGRIIESYRIANSVKNNTHIPKIIPYFWYKYHGGQKFLTKVKVFWRTKRKQTFVVLQEDVFNAFLTLSTSDVDAVVIWGSSNDVNTKAKCLDLYQYVDNVLGPSLVNNF